LIRKIVPVALLILIFLTPVLVRSLFVVHNRDPLSQISWTRYHNYDDVTTVLMALNETYPDVVDVFSIGKSVLGRDIYCVRLTNESDRGLKPEVLFVGYHHAREQITSESTFYFVVYAALNFGSNQTIGELLNKSEIYVIVALNVDGFALFEKNGYQRMNAHGVDLNRNYDYAWYAGGSSPFSEPETQALRDLVLAHHFAYAVSFHSGTQMILYPWANTFDPPPDEAKFIEISEDLSNVTGGTPYRQSSLLYITNGNWEDWMYAVAHVLAFTVEIFDTGQTLVLRPPAPYDARPNQLTGPTPRRDPSSRVSLKYTYNPPEEMIETVVLRWLPVFFYIANRTINESTLIPNGL